MGNVLEAEIEGFFDRYGYSAELLEPGIWRAAFAAENEEEFDLYVMLGEEWIHFAISPFVAKAKNEAHAARVWERLLHLNQELRLARFGLDDDGDLNLLADLPRTHFGYEQFALALDALTHYAQRLAPELTRFMRSSG